ncbi:MAG: hypothetical protein V3V92_02470 [Candidatus Hydrothermarchaeales archaeon]
MAKVRREKRDFIEHHAEFLRMAEELGVLDELSDEYPKEVQLIRELVVND